ncbi:hypothetical protein Sjap_006656 [Stephania japonica]|uniref:Uncharacterized protein n=1 Tax=Stephania japonica TaxID=461633 RepID=A0AAP0PJ48_9MAGN
MERLFRTLTTIKAVLADAETKQLTSKLVEVWVDKLKDAAYDADDLLDEWATDEAILQQPSNNSNINKNKVHASLTSLKKKAKRTMALPGIARMIKKIRQRFDEIDKEKSAFDLSIKQELAAIGDPTENRREARYASNEPHIIKLLLDTSNNDGVSVFPILGMDGVGKTTLAQLVYNEANVHRHFDTRIWHHVSDDFDVKRVSRSVLEDVTKTPFTLQTLNAIQRELQEQLKGKQFLLVLDDVRNTKQESWNMFKNSLTSGLKGSSIIITTTLQIVAEIAGTVPAHEPQPQIYGRDADREKIVHQLLQDTWKNDGVSVLSIVGAGGIGKTSVARLVYNDERVCKHFEFRIWYPVGDGFDVKKISKAIVESVSGRQCELDVLESVQVRLRETLEGKRFLLVLDNVWSEKQEDWTKFMRSLTSGAKGSSVILTTRMANIPGATSIYELSSLSDHDCWMLFRSHAFTNERDQQNPNLLEIGQQLVKKCRGVPIATKVLGSLLYSMQDERQWERIRDDKVWDLDRQGLAALRLTYHYLTSHARRCFAYCSLYPKEYVMEKENLIQIWMANGLIPVNESTEPEVAGDMIFKELLSHTMLEGTEWNGDGNVVKCRMHDLFHHLASTVSKNDSVCIETSGEIDLYIARARHLSVIGSSSELRLNHPSLSLQGLRTLMVFNDQVSFPMLPDFTHLTCLRTLHLKGVVGLSSLHGSLGKLGKLRHLRYLDLTSCALKFLPKSFCELRNLQSLNLAGNDLQALSSSVSNLKKLRYLNLSWNVRITSLPESIGGLKSLQTLDLEHCHGLEALPSSIGDLRNLKYLNLSHSEITSLPESIGGLQSLRILNAMGGVVLPESTTSLVC